MMSRTLAIVGLLIAVASPCAALAQTIVPKPTGRDFYQWPAWSYDTFGVSRVGAMPGEPGWTQNYITAVERRDWEGAHRVLQRARLRTVSPIAWGYLSARINVNRGELLPPGIPSWVAIQNRERKNTPELLEWAFRTILLREPLFPNPKPPRRDRLEEVSYAGRILGRQQAKDTRELLALASFEMESARFDVVNERLKRWLLDKPADVDAQLFRVIAMHYDSLPTARVRSGLRPVHSTDIRPLVQGLIASVQQTAPGHPSLEGMTVIFDHFIPHQVRVAQMRAYLRDADVLERQSWRYLYVQKWLAVKS